jgi:hypothetical protein
MAYNPNIPMANDVISQSQPLIEENFQEINTLIQVNHATFGTPNAGKHNIVTLPVNANPTPTLIGEGSIYSETSALTGNTELAWQRDNGGPVIEWTGLGAGTNGWTRLPSGILLKWGTVSAALANPVVVLYPVPIIFPLAPVFTNVFTIFVNTLSAANPSIAVVIPASITNVGFLVNTFLSNTGAFVGSTFNYLAIGK